MQHISRTSSQAHKTLIIGLGETGLSVARFLHKKHRDFAVIDDQENLLNYEVLLQDVPAVDLYVGLSNKDYFDGAEEIIISPGVPLDIPVLQDVRKQGASLIGDIELFAQSIDACCRVAAITGSNGKTTVTTLLERMIQQSNIHVAAGGNRGRPALDLLADAADVYVLELSSFQLETSFSLKPTVSVVLNVCADHLDRYPSIDAYRAAKQRIHNNSSCIVVNRMEALPEIPVDTKCISFGLDEATDENFGVKDSAITCGDQVWVECCDLGLSGDIGVLNTQAAFAMGKELGLTQQTMVEVACQFSGLPHRLQKIGSRNGVDWVDDSKATNVGAVISGLQSIDKPVVLICGGVGKNADFSSLADIVSSKVRDVLVMGRDAAPIASALKDCTDVHRVSDMHEAVALANQLATAGDCVLLSPACASFDMYQSYAERGDQFISEFMSLQA